MPVTRWSKIGVEVAAGDTLIAELGSLSLEFTRLSQLTGDMKYFDAVQRVTDCLEGQQHQTKVPGMFPHVVNARECYFGSGTDFSLGGQSDSVYEYLPKEYLLLGGRTSQTRTMYEKALVVIKKSAFFRPLIPDNRDILLSGKLKASKASRINLDPQMQHLTCFAGGMVALGAKLFNEPNDVIIARKLVDGCVWAYNSTATGIMPETFHTLPCPDSECKWNETAWGNDLMSRNSYNEDASRYKILDMEERIRRKVRWLRMPEGMTAIASRQYLLRPEAIESIFVLYRITGDEQLREQAWTMFESIVRQTRTEFAFSAIEDVTKPTSRQIDSMESFWTAETLKYFYLLFEKPDVVSLDEFVMNTEAHPFRLDWRP